MNHLTSQPARYERCEREVAPDALFCPICGAPRVRSDDSLIGALIADRYLVRQRLGHGGSGNIYYAEHVTLRKKVAIKGVMRPGADFFGAQAAT